MQRVLLAVVMCLSGLPALSGNPSTTSVEFDASHLPQVKVGETTLPQVRAWFGAPWKIIQFSDDGLAGDIIWEYRGHDSHGAYRVHFEFDKNGGRVKLMNKFAE